MNIASLRTNAAAENEGVWLEFMGAEFKIASNASTAYRTALAKAGRKHNAATLRLRPDLVDAMNLEAMADGILLDFRGDVKDGEEPLDPKNREHRLRLLRIRAFAEWVAEQSTSIANFQTEALESVENDLKSGGPVDPKA